MKKRLFRGFIATFVALMALSSLNVSAATTTTRLDYNLDASYNVTNHASTMNIFYDIGSALPYDDVRASTKAASTSGLSVTAKTIIYSRINNTRAESSKNEKGTVGWVYSGEAGVAGEDYARNIKHEMYRKIIGQNEAEGLIYNIY